MRNNIRMASVKQRRHFSTPSSIVQVDLLFLFLLSLGKCFYMGRYHVVWTTCVWYTGSPCFMNHVCLRKLLGDIILATTPMSPIHQRKRKRNL